MTHVHHHKDHNGFLHACYHKCRVIVTWQFWVGMTIGFPLEHFLWEKVWPFKAVAHWFGL